MQAAVLQGWIKRMSDLSREGREIGFYASGKDEAGPLDTLIFGVFHGDEPESGALTQRFLQEVSPAEFGERRVGVVPVVNPDGLALGQRMNAAGVDLNRNYPTCDWAELNGGTIYYSGPAAASEPETRFILRLMADYPPAKIVSVHTPYKVINYDGPAEALAQAMAVENGYPVVSDIGYATPGSFGTYVGKERNIPTVTLELPEEGFDEAELLRNLAALRAAVLFDVI